MHAVPGFETCAVVQKISPWVPSPISVSKRKICMQSQVLRLALELNFFRRGYLVPYLSLDIPWCWEGYRRAPFVVGNRSFDYGC